MYGNNCFGENGWPQVIKQVFEGVCLPCAVTISWQVRSLGRVE